MISIALFIGLPDGEVFLHHLTTPPTRDLTIHWILCAVATLGKATGRRVSGNGVASYMCHLDPLGEAVRGADGEMFGEVSGEVFLKHPTIRIPL